MNRFPWKKWHTRYMRTTRLWWGQCPDCGSEMMGFHRSDLRGFAEAHIALRHAGGAA